jgi:predicted ribosome quality control (RQC) complex YloA/Tae2 family protein
MAFFKELEGSSLKDISLAENDKLVTMDFGEYKLVLRFYNSPNALLYQKENIIASFKKEKSVTIETRHVASLSDGIRSRLPMLGKWLEAELENELKSKKNFDLDKECKLFDKQLRESKHSFVYVRKSGLLLSPTVLHSLSDSYEEYNNVSEAIDYIIRARSKQSTFKSKKDALLVKLQGALIRTTKAINDAASGVENSERAERYTAIADEIQIQAHEIQKGAVSLSLIISGKDVIAPLDRALSAFDNAKRYYDKAKRAREMQKELQARLVTLNKEKDKLANFIKRVGDIFELKEIDTIEKEISAQGFALSHTSEELTETDPLSKFRQFIVAGGYRVLVGKNAKHNDELTMKVAKKEDIWFHARHVPGSHVLLQTNNAKQIPKEAIEQAAEIAAYFSDAKTQKHAPVAYTKRKFVRKPKGAVPGAVVIEKEEVVIVTPRIPA